MSTPGPPLIRIRPRATDTTLEFWWNPPVNDGGSPILSYVLNGPSSNDLDSNARYSILTGLTNKTDYTFTLQASNANGLGETATFRTVQPGLLPPAPSFLSIYRQSETAATLSWSNTTTDGNTPDPWRNIVVAPVVASNGTITYPGDNSVTSNATRLFGTETHGNISVPLDVSANFIVRAQNDPGYSYAFNGTGTFSLKDVNYTGDILVAPYSVSNYASATNFSVQKKSLGPTQNLSTLANSFSNTNVTTHQRGIVFTESNTTDASSHITAVSKNGFVKFRSPPLAFNNLAQATSRTNPIIPIVPDQSFPSADSNLPVYVFDSSDSTFGSTIIQHSGTTLTINQYNNNRDTNAWFSIGDGVSNYYQYSIPSGSKIPVLRYTSAGYISVENQIDKELFVLCKEPTDTTYSRILYFPNTGSYVSYDISSLGITNIASNYAFSSGKLISYGTDGITSNAYTFTLTGTPSNEVRILSGGGINVSQSSNSFSNFYKGFSKLTASISDLSGGNYFAIAPNSSQPAEAFNGTAQVIAETPATTTFSGYTYSNSAGDWYFTGVGHPDGTCSSFQLKANGIPLDSANFFTVPPTTLDYPEYSLHVFGETSGSNTGVLVKLQYDSNTSLFDVSGSYTGKDTIISYSQNSNINYITLDHTFGAEVSYMVSKTIFPPSTLSTFNVTGAFFSSWYSTFPSGNYTLGIISGTNIYHIFNGAAFDSSGTIGFTPDSVARGPDCWYFYTVNGGASVSVTRISTTGAKVTQNFPIANDTNVGTPKVMPNGYCIQVNNTSSGKYELISFDTTRNTFERKVLDSQAGSLRTTYVPNL